MNEVRSLSLYNYLLNKSAIERRPEQEKFINIVLSTINGGRHTAIIEAPTGIGKTYGYLIPLLETRHKAIISTGTKLLQDQLKRDIERLSIYYFSLTGSFVRYLVFKGKNNYLCLDRFEEIKKELSSNEPSGSKVKVVIPDEVVSVINNAMTQRWDGDFDGLNLNLRNEIKKELCVDDDYCTESYRRICPFRKECYYWARLKKEEKDASLLIVNHAILGLKEFQDIEEKVLVIDEAHELDRYLVKSLTKELSLYTLIYEILGNFRKLVGDFGFLGFINDIKRLKENIVNFFQNSFEKGLEQKSEIPVDSFKLYSNEFDQLVRKSILGVYDEIFEQMKKFLGDYMRKNRISDGLREYLLAILKLEPITTSLAVDGLSEKEKSFVKKVKPLEALKRKIDNLNEFYQWMVNPREDYGYAVSKDESERLKEIKFNYKLKVFPLFPKNKLHYNDYKAVIATSATLDYEDLKETVGLEGEYFKLNNVFSYKRAKFVIVDVNPSPREYTEKARLIALEDWKTGLCNSYEKLCKKFDKVMVLLTNKEHLELFEKTYCVAFQGEIPLSKLVSKLNEGEIKALIGLDSLWFGIDVKGEKGILMSKLPYENPDEPLTYHRRKYLKAKGYDPFNYVKRKAVIKFRQGIGRLMRSETDGGVIVLCDGRILYSGHAHFLKILKDLGVEIIVTDKNLHKKKTL